MICMYVCKYVFFSFLAVPMEADDAEELIQADDAEEVIQVRHACIHGF